jgi:hypothetical protein
VGDGSFFGVVCGTSQLGAKLAVLGFQSFDTFPRPIGGFFGFGSFAYRHPGDLFGRGATLIGLDDCFFGFGHLAGGLGPSSS